jgi:hypothetical protein
MFYRQRAVASENELATVRNGNEMLSNPIYASQSQQQQQQLQANDEVIRQAGSDQTCLEQQQQQYVHLQQQQAHHIPHSKLHSLDRFAARANLLPNELNVMHGRPMESHAEETIQNDFHSNENNNNNNNNNNYAPPTSAGSNNLIQIEFAVSANPHNNNNHNEDENGLDGIDLNELDETQLKQLRDEEEKQNRAEYLNLEHLNRLYCQAQFLYKIRGKKLEEVTNRFTAFQEDVSREMRAMKHRVYLAEKDKDSVQVSLDQMNDLCNKYKAETELAVRNLNEQQDKCSKLKETNRQLEKRLAEFEQEIESLQLHLNEQQKLDTFERVKEQNEEFIQKLREQYERDLFQLKERLGAQENALGEKNEHIKRISSQLDEMSRNIHEASVEKAEAVIRLTKNLNEMQAKYNQDMQIYQHNNKLVTFFGCFWGTFEFIKKRRK